MQSLLKAMNHDLQGLWTALLVSDLFASAVYLDTFLIFNDLLNNLTCAVADDLGNPGINVIT